MAKRGSVKTFIENAIKIHQGVYDYSNVVYVNSRTLVSIICPKHGAFLKSPNNHLSGQGCPQCTSDRIGRTPNMDTHKFIMRAKSIHGEKYIYDDVVYVNNTEKVNIYCPKHGIFRQRPNDHLRGKGCPVCFSERLGRIHVMNTGVFIQRAKEIHKDKYDYSKVQYKNMATKVEIICPIHGIFMQRPSDHLKGKGCTKCACEKMKIVKSMTKEEFISRATVIHKAKYNYDKVEIINGRKKVAIICPVHGVFYQSPEVHLQQKCGCKKCADEKNADKLRLSKEDFISRAISIHGRKYDYADVNYINSNTKVKIKCPIHGTFLQAPSVHINQKCGCPKCAIALNASEKRKTTDAFVREARTMHGDKYDYSKTKYVNSNTLVEIVCKIHGSFFQLPTIHLRQNGGNCPKCVGKYKTTEDFIKEAQEIHGNKYNYSKTKYISAKDKVCIICSKHGEYWQNAIDHLKGKGCPKCKTSKLENIIMKQLEDNSIEYIYQKRFVWLKYKSYLSLDFFLPNQNIAIECQGQQHFGIFTKKSTIFKNIEEIQYRDMLKHELCKEHNIQVVYFCELNDKIPVSYFDKIFFDTNELIAFINNRTK